MIKNLWDKLYIGDEIGYNQVAMEQYYGKPWSIVGAAKNPYHKQHARYDGSEEDGYVEKALPKDSKEYYYAEREHALYLNLIDVDDIKYISADIIETALEFITREMQECNRNVFICCNKAESRSPSLAFMHMIREHVFDGESYTEAFEQFRNIHHEYNPKRGMLEWTKIIWRETYGEQA